MTLDERLSRAARQVAEGLNPPEVDLDAVRGIARRRHRAVVATSAAAAAVLVVIAVATGVVDQRGASPTPPINEPSITESPTIESGQRFAPLSPEEIRNHPEAQVEQRANDNPVTGAAGVGARVWSVCLDERACRRDDSSWFDGTIQQALEVTDDGFRTSAIHPLAVRANVSHAVDDWFFVDRNYTLVDSQGGRRVLTGGSALPVTDVAGPLVFTDQGFAWVDLASGEVHRIVSDEGTWEWSGADDTWFWGNVYRVNDSGRIADQGLTWRNDDGTFGVRMLPIEFSRYSTQILRSGTPGTMAAVDPGPPYLLHVSTDYGATWQVRIIPSEVEKNSAGPLAVSTLPADWESWPTP